MGDKLVIVESPAKARTIKKYLGAGYQVEASMGHVRDLPRRSLGIDIDDEFAPAYEVSPGKERVIAQLKKVARSADAVYLATDPDREGEAIAWHITQAVGMPRSKPVYRVVFSEITGTAVRQAIAAPRSIDQHLVDAQQARRVLDRLVGYKLSPLLWEKVRRGLSAGRVQSVAVRLVVEREREIEAFTAREYWSIEADLAQHDRADPRDAFRATLIERSGTRLDRFAIADASAAQAVVAELSDAAYAVRTVTRRDKRRTPAPPFTTSTLQQEAGRKLGFSAKRTMVVAQQLYEGVDLGGTDGATGLISYMRTDSFNVSAEAQAEARELINARYGAEYVPERPPSYRQRARGAQEAHEAIRPTSSQRAPEAVRTRLTHDQFRLYDLIWKRFVASQMAPAIFDATTVDITATRPGADADQPAALFRATGSVLKFAGFLAVYHVSLDEGEVDEDREARLPVLAEGQRLMLRQLLPVQHFTEPPPRYTEASLVKELERLGIGRPSTYAPTISTIVDREYVELREKKLWSTMLGHVVTDLLVEHFPSIIDVGFTSEIEAQLDTIADGETAWVPVIRAFYAPFAARLGEAQQQMRNVKREELLTDVGCPRCGEGQLTVKFGRNGEFLACSRFNRDGGQDSCDFTSDFSRDSDGRIVLATAASPEMSTVACHTCGKPMVIKKSRFGPFLGCSDYPTCKTTRRLRRDGSPAPLPVRLGRPCPRCTEGELVERTGRFGRPFVGCDRYPRCDYLLDATPGDGSDAVPTPTPAEPATTTRTRRAAAPAEPAATTRTRRAAAPAEPAATRTRTRRAAAPAEPAATTRTRTRRAAAPAEAGRTRRPTRDKPTDRQ